MPRLAEFLTDFADGGVIVPLCLVVAATLLALRQGRTALAWALVTAAVWTVTLGLKLGFGTCEALACPVPPPSLDLVSPSGHVAAAAAAYGGLLGLVVRTTGRPSWAAGAGAAVVALLVGVTRVALHAHSVAEVVAGGLVGVAGAVSFTAVARGMQPARRLVVLFGVAGVAVMLFHGTHLTWEDDIRAASLGAARHLEGGS